MINILPNPTVSNTLNNSWTRLNSFIQWILLCQKNAASGPVGPPQEPAGPASDEKSTASTSTTTQPAPAPSDIIAWSHALGVDEEILGLARMPSGCVQRDILRGHRCNLRRESECFHEPRQAKQLNATLQLIPKQHYDEILEVLKPSRSWTN